MCPFGTGSLGNREVDATIYTSQAEAQGHATVHYVCTDCTGVTIDATSASGPVETNAAPDAIDDYGAAFTLTPPDLSSPLTVTVRNGGTVDIDALTFTPTETPTAWFQPGEQVVHPSRGPRRTSPPSTTGARWAVTATRRAPTSANSGACTCGRGPPPKRCGTNRCGPSVRDVFGIGFRIDLTDGADQLAYILHRGDTKDPGLDQFLVFDAYGQEIWQLQGAGPEKPLRGTASALTRPPCRPRRSVDEDPGARAEARLRSGEIVDMETAWVEGRRRLLAAHGISDES